MKKIAVFVFLFLLSIVCAAAGETGNNPIAVPSGIGNNAEGGIYGKKDGGVEGITFTFYGQEAGFSLTSGIQNTFIGYKSGYSNTEGICNVFLGCMAGYYNTTADNNTFLGSFSGYSNTTGEYNTFIGLNSGALNSTGLGNTFVGNEAGYYNTTASTNTFLGSFAGHDNTTGAPNTFLGSCGGQYNSTGSFNAFIGSYAGTNNATGHDNTFLGEDAGHGNTTGSSNTFIGRLTGHANTAGIGNTFLGYSAGYNETGSNKLYIDNTSTSDPLIYGEFDNNIVNINGKLGLGTKTPGYPIEVARTGANASIVLNRTDGAKNYVNATATFGNFGTVNNYPLRLVVNSLGKMTLNTDNSLSMVSGATCTAGGVWTNASSIALKENISTLGSEEAATTLLALNPVKYNYKAEKDENHVGFIAEEVPELVAMKDRKTLSTMDIVAVLTKVTQDQQNQLQEQKQIIEKMKMEIAELKMKHSE
jgi:hypothetical protein